MSEKERIIERLRATGDDAVRRLRALPEASFSAGRYESGWNAKQILAHIASIEWTYARLVGLAQQSTADAPTATEASGASREQPAAVPQGPPRGGMDDYNARQVEKRASVGIDELIDEFAANRARTIAAVTEADDRLFTSPIRSAGGITGTLAQVLDAIAIDHVMSHVGDITGEPWTGRS